MESTMESDDFGELYTDIQLLPFCPPQAQVSRRQSVSSASSFDGEDDERRPLVSDGAELGDSVMREDKDGESEDDGLHIILNDRDCPAGGPGLPNASGVGCFDDDDNIVIVAGGDPSSKESKRAAGLSSDGFQQLPHLSRYKYVRPHAKASGTSSSVIDGRGNWDSNEGGPPMFSSSTALISPLPYMTPATARNKPEFYLPRNRTIFDIDINKFDQKPWMSTGVDKSDFFNFGLDEESWRVYCTDLKVLYHEQYQQRTLVKNGINVHRSSPSKRKVSGNVVHHEFQSSKCAPAEISLTKRRESSLHSLESSEVREWILEMPKGRAIQVEDSMIERMPSMELRHAQYRDADVVIQIPLQGATDNAQPELDLILEKPPLNFEKIESDMNNDHLKEHQDNASADDSRSSLTRYSQAKSLCSLVSQNEVETHANCRDPSAEKVSDVEENGSNSLAKDCESPDRDHDNQSFSGQFDDDKDHFEVSENGVSLETLDSCSYHSQADSQILEEGECSSHQVQFCNSGLKRKADHNGASPAKFNHDCHSEEHATIKHRACTSRQPLSSTNYKRGGLSCYEDERVGASEVWKHDIRQQTEKACLTSSIKPNIDRKSCNDYFDSRRYNLEKRLPKDELRGQADYISNSRHFERRIRERFISNFFSEEKRHRYKVERKDNEPKFRYQRDKWLNWEYDKLYYKSHQHEKPGPYSDQHQPESSQDRYGRHVPGIDSRHGKWAKKLFLQNHHSGCKKTKRQCIHALPLSDHTRRNSGIPDSICYYRAHLQGYDDHDSYRGHVNEWGPDDGTHRDLKFSDEGDWLYSSGKFPSYPLSRSRSPYSDENIWGEIASKYRRNDSNLHYESHDRFFVEHAISNKTRGSNSCRSLGQINELGRKLLLDNHLAWCRNGLESDQCTDLDVEMPDDTLNFRKPVHLNFVRRKFHPRSLIEEEDMRGQRHHRLSSGYSAIYGNYKNLPAGREALKNECIEAVSHGDGDLCSKTSAETNVRKGPKKLQVVGNQKDSCFAARKSLVIQNQRCTVLREKKSKMSEISREVKLKCSSKLEYKTLDSSDVLTEKAKAVEENEQKRILETLQKMERRKERFKESITPEKEQMRSSKHRKSETPVEAAELKLQRPVRKRRWGKQEGASIISAT